MQKKVLSVLLTAAMAFSLAACGGSSGAEAQDSKVEAPAAEEDRTYKVDVVLKTTSSEYWQYVQAGAEAYMEQFPNVTVEVKGAANETAYDEHKKILEDDIASGNYDAFVIAPLKASDTVAAISGLEAPVVAVDTDIRAPEVISFVATSNEEAARLGGEAAVQAAEDAGWTEIKAVCISGVKGDTTAQARLTGYEAGIITSGGEFLADETVYGDAEGAKAEEAMKEIMEKHPEGIAIICANNDDMAMGAARAAKGNEAYKNTVFIGFDGIKSACEAILAGEETISVAQEAYDMGYTAVDTAVKALDGEALTPVIFSGQSIIDKTNAEERLKKLEEYVK